jgi:hypothetical protein
LLEPDPERARLSEYLAVEELPLDFAKGLDPKFDDSPWRRHYRAYQEGPLKFIWSSDGRHELFDRGSDPQELVDLSSKQPDAAAQLAKQLDGYVGGLTPVLSAPSARPTVSEEHRKRLEALGYLAPAVEPSPRSAPTPGRSG